MESDFERGYRRGYLEGKAMAEKRFSLWLDARTSELRALTNKVKERKKI